MRRLRNKSGVTLLEMLIVVAIVACIVGISFPALSAGLSGVRLSSAAGSVASYLTSSMNNVERREEPAAIIADAHGNRLAVFTAADAKKPRTTLELPQGIAIEGEDRRWLLYPGGAFPRMMIVLHNDKGARRSVEIDPVTGVPEIKRLEEQPGVASH